MLARQNTTADARKRDLEACVLTPSIPAGKSVGVLGLHNRDVTFRVGSDPIPGDDFVRHQIIGMFP